MVPLAKRLNETNLNQNGGGKNHFGKNYNLLLFLLPFCSLLLFLLLIWIWPPKASELQTVHCIVGNVVDILHGCWAEEVHLCLAGFGTRGPLFGCFGTPSLLGGPRTVGPWFPGFGGLWRKKQVVVVHLDLLVLLTLLKSLDSCDSDNVAYTLPWWKMSKVNPNTTRDYLPICKSDADTEECYI